MIFIEPLVSVSVCSHLNALNLVIHFVVKLVVVSDQLVAGEWKIWLLEVRVVLGKFSVEFIPSVVVLSSLIFVLLDSEWLAHVWLHFKGLLEGVWVNFLQDSLESNQTLLEDLVPMVLSEIVDDWHKHWESFVLVGLQDVQEVVVFEEAHGSVGNLQVISSNGLNNSLEKFRDQFSNLIDLTHLKYLLKLGQEESLLDTVGEWPVLEKAFKKRDGQCAVLG